MIRWLVVRQLHLEGGSVASVPVEVAPTEAAAALAVKEHAQGLGEMLRAKIELTDLTLRDALGALGIEKLSYAYGPIGDEQRILEPDVKLIT